MTNTDLRELAPDALARIEDARTTGKNLVRAAHADGDQIWRKAAACAIGRDSDLFPFARDQADLILVQGRDRAMIHYLDVMTYEYFSITPAISEFELLLKKLSATAMREFQGDSATLEFRRREWSSRALGAATLQKTTCDEMNSTFWQDLRTQFLALACPHLYAVLKNGWWSLGGLPKEPCERDTLDARFCFTVGRAVARLGFTDLSVALAVWLDLLVTTKSHHYSGRCINNLCVASAEYCLALIAVEHEAPNGSPEARVYKSTLGRNIDRLRKECGWSFDGLARRTGFNKTSILDHVNKGTPARAATLKMYAEAFSKRLNRPVMVTELEAKTP